MKKYDLMILFFFKSLGCGEITHPDGNSGMIWGIYLPVIQKPSCL